MPQLSENIVAWVFVVSMGLVGLAALKYLLKK